MLVEKNKDLTILTPDHLINVLNEVNASSFIDQFGPEEVAQIYDPFNNTQAVLVIDNSALGPAIGSIRIANDVSPKNTFLLARDTSYKSALFELPFGGAQVGIKTNSNSIDKSKLLKSLGKAIEPLIPWRYIVSLDSQFNAHDINDFIEVIGDRKGITGKPEKTGGSSYNAGTIGFGVGISIESSIKALHEILNLPESLEDVKISIDGWNNTSIDFAKILISKGAKITAISDKQTTIFNENGLEFEELKKSFSLSNIASLSKNFTNSENIPKEKILNVDSDILVLTNTPGIISENNLDQIKANLIIEATNDSLNDKIEQKLYDKCKWTIPNLLTMSGNIISGYSEYSEKSISEAFSLIESKIKSATEEIIFLSFRSELLPRFVAKDIAQARILEAIENKN